MKRTAWIVLAVAAAGAILRSLRLDWQPIWWDEGYSIYFATEPLGRMVWLTARDIHPPLYYALLHGWTGLFGPSPASGRVLSLLLGIGALPLIYWLGRAMFPHRVRTAWFALLLLTFSPIHLYYSQEIRMYGLAVTLGLGASYALWRWMDLRRQRAPAGTGQDSAAPAAEWRAGSGWAFAYLTAGVLALYTLYYAALLLFAHAVWALVRLRKDLKAGAALGGVYLLMLLLYLPWLAYAVPQLVGYVGGKVRSDQDIPLGPLAYVERHLVAFTAGQVRLGALPAEWLALAPATVAICAIILGLVLVQTLQPGPRSRTGGQATTEAARSRAGRPGASAALRPARAAGAANGGARPPGAVPADQPARSGASGPATAALWTWLAVPVLLGWLINLRLPFFPAGGERLLLVTLPYLLLLLAYGIDRTWKIAHLGKVAAVALAINAVLGVTAFYATPRYAADDYRPLIRQMVQQGDDTASFLAIFPWQVGYWRAYHPFGAGEQRKGQQSGQQSGGLTTGQAPAGSGPAPILLSDGAVAWSPAVAAEIDAALARGTVWFPAPLTFGSSLPPQIEAYLAEKATNLENRWYDATRLTAWAQLSPPAVQPLAADFGLVQLAAAGIAPPAAPGANTPVAATLVWQSPPGPTSAQGPGTASESEPGAGDDAAMSASVSLRLQDKEGHVWASREYARSLPPAGQALTETVGLIVPVGLPPGGYQVAVSVQTAGGEPLTLAGSDAVAAAIGNLEVTLPEAKGAGGALRLPIQHPLPQPVDAAGVRLLGYTGPDHRTPLLAGTELAATLFLGKRGEETAPVEVYLSLIDSQGNGVAGYEGWPLPSYPPAAWTDGTLVQAPVAFNLPGALTTGSYRLVAGFRAPETGEKTPPAELATLAVEQRAASFSRPTPEQPFAAPPQLGTHARVLGYDVAPGEDGTHVRLYWEVLQPLLPPHHIFVHLDAADGQTLAQADGPPAAAEGLAPTGSWQPGEFLVTEHRLRAPLAEGEVVRVGLYDPRTQLRLPVTVDGAPAGDSVVLP